MDYPVLVNPGKPSQAVMKKKTREADQEPLGNRKRGKTAGKASRESRQGARPTRAGRAQGCGQPQPPARPVAPDDARPTIRRLRPQLARAQARIEQLQASADTDFLLDIPNRRGFERELKRSIAYIKRYHASGALIVLDVDRLKPINDAFGHAAGDQVLKAIVGALLAQVRSSDVIGRLGGDEFALLLWNLSETDARAKAAALEQAIDRLTFMFRGRTVTAGASAGVAILGPHAEAGRRWRRPIARCMCARRNGGTKS